MDLELSDEQTWLAESVQTLLAREWSPAPDAPYGDAAERDRLWRALVDFGALSVGGADGLGIVCRVIAAAPRWLAPGGHLLVELSERQAPRAAEAAARSGLIPRVASSAELAATVVIGTRPAARLDMSEVPVPG